VLGTQHRRQPLIGRWPVVDQQDPSPRPGVRHGAALRRLHTDLKRRDGAHAQFIGHHLQPRQRTYPRNQHDVGHRLGQEIVGPGFQPTHAIGRAVQRGDNHDRNEMRLRIRLQPAANLKTVDIGHHHVEQNEVAFGSRADVKRLGATGRGQDIEILGRQPRFQKLDVGGHVIDDQNTRGHRKSLPDKASNGFNKFSDRNRLG